MRQLRRSKEYRWQMIDFLIRIHDSLMIVGSFHKPMRLISNLKLGVSRQKLDIRRQQGDKFNPRPSDGV